MANLQGVPLQGSQHCVSKYSVQISRPIERIVYAFSRVANIGPVYIGSDYSLLGHAEENLFLR